MPSITDQAQAVAAGSVSPVELVTAALEALERVEMTTNAFTHVFPDDALDRARNLEASEPKGPLHGVPVVVKDLYDMAGVPTTGCCAVYERRIAEADGAVVRKLRDAGAVIIAKTNQHELALGTNNQLSFFGAARNPWDLDRSPGGSSGGSAIAVATGVVNVAMGSDTGGSIRIPASFCGVTGLKPTHGAVSLRGVMPLAPSLDTAGPLAASAEDCAVVHRIIRGFDPDDVWSRPWTEAGDPDRPFNELRILIPAPWFRSVTQEVSGGVRSAARVLEGLGARIEEIDDLDPEGVRERVAPMLLVEAAYHFGHLIEDERVTEPTRQLLSFGAAVNGRDYIRSRDMALALRRRLELALSTADALLVPATPYPAPRVDVDSVEVNGESLSTDAVGTTRCTLPVNTAGLPALAFPVGFSSDGMPLGAQLIGRPWSEELLCALGAAYQQATDWHLRRHRS